MNPYILSRNLAFGNSKVCQGSVLQTPKSFYYLSGIRNFSTYTDYIGVNLEVLIFLRSAYD